MCTLSGKFHEMQDAARPEYQPAIHHLKLKNATGANTVCKQKTLQVH